MNFIVLELEVLDNEALTSTDKIVYGYIVALSQKKGYTYIKIEKLAQITHLSIRQLNRCIAKLIYFNYITQNIIKKVRYLQPTVNRFIADRQKDNENKMPELFDYNWLEDEEN